MLGLFENGFVYSERYRQLSIERGGTEYRVEEEML